MRRRIQLGQHHHRSDLGPQRQRIAAPTHPLGHPAHLPVPPGPDEIRQPPGQLGNGIGPAHAHGGEPLVQGLRRQPCLEISQTAPVSSGQ